MSGCDVAIDLVAPGWATAGATQVRGYAHLDDRYHSAAELARVLDAASTDEQWVHVLGRLNGCFAVVTRRPGAVLAAVDRTRSIPLFHSVGGTRGSLSDSAHRVASAVGKPAVDPIADVEFQLTGYVTGHETLLRGVHQVQAGEFICWDTKRPDAPARIRYYAFEHGDYFTTDAADLVDRLELVHHDVFRRLLESVGDRQIVVPLSGGFDSRLIGTSLRDLGARNVVCYTYGLPGNWETRISEELARYLGFRWEFVPYSAQRWREWAADEGFAAYFRTAGNLASVPHVQDWPAVRELKREDRIDPDGVFVPGHSGDFLAGSHVPAAFFGPAMVRRKKFFDELFRAHYSLWDWPEGSRDMLRRAFTPRIEAVIGRSGDTAAAVAADLFERWDLQERQAKFICNSVRVYEHFGHDWRLPLFDHELMDFWARVPLAQRIGRKLYFEFARQRQQLPVTAANTDRGLVMRGAIRGIEAAGLKPLAKSAAHAYARMHWREVQEHSSLGWLGLVDPEFFRRTFTGKENAHSYLARAYRELWGASPGKARSIIPALGDERPTNKGSRD